MLAALQGCLACDVFLYDRKETALGCVHLDDLKAHGGTGLARGIPEPCPNLTLYECHRPA